MRYMNVAYFPQDSSALNSYFVRKEMWANIIKKILENEENELKKGQQELDEISFEFNTLFCFLHERVSRPEKYKNNKDYCLDLVDRIKSKQQINDTDVEFLKNEIELSYDDSLLRLVEFPF